MQFGFRAIVLFSVIICCLLSTASSKYKEPVLSDSMDYNKVMQPIDSMVNRVMKSLRLVGATVAIVKDEKLVYAKGFGYADKENKILVTEESLLELGQFQNSLLQLL